MKKIWKTLRPEAFLADSPHAFGRLKYFSDAKVRLPPPLAAVMVLGIGNQLGQVLVLRELLMVFHGHELTLGIILASWVAWEAVGSWLGTLAAERTKKPLKILTGLALAVVLVMPINLLTIRFSRNLFDAVPGTHLSLVHTAVTCFFIAAPVCILLGAQFVLLARLWREHRKTEDMSGAVRAYTFDALGHMAGGLLFSLLLVHIFMPIQIAVIFGVMMLGGLIVLRVNTLLFRRLSALLLISALISAFFLRVPDIRTYQLQWESFRPGSRLVETRQSKYGLINVSVREGQYSFFQSNHLTFSTGSPEDDLTGFAEVDAARFTHLAVPQHADPEKALLIGGGMRGMLREMLRYETLSIDYIELDRTMIDVAFKYLPRSTREALQDPRVNILAMDGRMHIKTTPQKYDIIIVDVPDPATAVLNRFYTREFFIEAAGRLSEGGILAISVTSTPGLRHSAVVNRNATLYHTLRDVFSDVIAVGEDNSLFMASNRHGLLTTNPDLLRQRFIKEEIDSPDFSDRHYYTLLRDNAIRRKNWILRNHGRHPGSVTEPPLTGPLFPESLQQQKELDETLVPVERRFFINSDSRPIGYFHTLIYLDELAGQRGGGILKMFLHIRLWWIFIPAAGLAVTGFVLVKVSRKTNTRAHLHYAVGYSVFSIGFSSMLLEVTLIFAFQSVYGYVFEQIGLIVAIFMAGLALGAIFSYLYLPRKAGLSRMSFIQAAFFFFSLILAAALPEAAALHSPPLIFFLFASSTFLAGILNGAHYPVAGTYRHILSGRAERSAGAVYALELVGACIGAVLSSVILVPVLGLAGACITAAIVNITAFLILWLTGRGKTVTANFNTGR